MTIFESIDKMRQGVKCSHENLQAVVSIQSNNNQESVYCEYGLAYGGYGIRMPVSSFVNMAMEKELIDDRWCMLITENAVNYILNQRQPIFIDSVKTSRINNAFKFISNIFCEAYQSILNTFNLAWSNLSQKEKYKQHGKQKYLRRVNFRRR